MRVFISWSGERSRRVAELLDDWLRCVIQAVNPWMSSKDIDRGSLWFTEISDQLANTGIGVICLTKENKAKPWILFEAGALAKGINSNRVCTFLIDLEPTDIENPLAQFNHTKPDKFGLWELVRTINISLKENALKESILEKVFNTYYSQFEERFKSILIETPEVAFVEPRNENDLLLEILSSVRTLDKRMRNIESENNLKFERNNLIHNNLNNYNNNIKNKIKTSLQNELEKDFKYYLHEGRSDDDITMMLSNYYQIPLDLTRNLLLAFKKNNSNSVN